jgi:hypothetical protein
MPGTVTYMYRTYKGSTADVVNSDASRASAEYIAIPTYLHTSPSIGSERWKHPVISTPIQCHPMVVGKRSSDSVQTDRRRLSPTRQ